MRKNSIGHDVIKLLSKGDYEAACDLFRTECDDFHDCDYADDIKRCVHLCLLPKMMHKALGVSDEKLMKAIEEVRGHYKGAS